MRKKLLVLLLTFCLISQCALGAGAAFEVYPLGDGSIEITGQKDSVKETTIMAFDNTSNTLLGAAQIGTGDDEYSVILYIGSPNGDTYAVRVNGGDIYYVKNVSASDAIVELEAASSGEIADVLEKYSKMFGLNMTNMEFLVNTDAVYEKMTELTFSSAEDVAAKFEKAIEEEIKAEMAAALKMIADGNAQGALSLYADIFAIDAESFRALSDKSTVYTALNGNTYTVPEFESAFEDALVLARINEASGANFKQLVTLYERKIGITASDIADSVFSKVDAKKSASFAELKQYFITETSLSKLNSASRETIQSVLTEENSVLGIFDTDGYYSLTDAQKASACMALAGGNYATVDAAKAEFASIIAAVKNSGNNTASSSNNGGGGSYGFSGSATAVTLPDTQTYDLPFSDIAKSHWGYASVAALYNEGIVAGTSETAFEPDREVKREEFVKMLIGTFDLYNANAVNVFTDIAADDWCESYVASAHEVGLTLGKGDGTFGKGDILTRQDMAVMAARCADIANVSLSGDNTAVFSDEAEFADYAKDSIRLLSSAGIINGVGDGVYAPYSSCTRVMAAKVCHALLNLYRGGAAN